MSDWADNSGAERLHQYQRLRRKFAFKSYMIAMIFALVSLFQWIAMLLVVRFRCFILEYYTISIACLFFALLLISIFVFFEGVRFITVINWLICFAIIECVTMGLGLAIVASNANLFAITFLVVSITMAIFIITGALMPHDLTLDVVILFVCAIVFFIGSAFFVLLFMLAGVPYSLYVYAGFVIIIVLLFIMYHAQTINGGRYAEMRRADFLLAALIIYHDYMILFLLTFYLATAISIKSPGATYFGWWYVGWWFDIPCEYCSLGGRNNTGAAVTNPEATQ